jgi:hypothetical protein
MRSKGKLPLGKSTFSDIRLPENNYLYVDKTQFVHDLVTNGTYYFLSRPRRFGKSLFLDTISELFKGSKELFEGLYIYDKWNWAQTFPVIKIDFTTGDMSSAQNLKVRIHDILTQNMRLLPKEHKILESTDLGSKFQWLISELAEYYNQKVVILIDEYDKPIIDNLQVERKEVAIAAREILRNFFSAIKASDAHIRFVFMTGVSKFTQMSLFSGLNNLRDITINAQFSSIAGYTQSDLETVFADYLENVDKEEVKRWYNGYNFLGEPVYNPYDILLFFSNENVFDNYWWETGGTRFLIDILKEGKHFIPDLGNLLVGKEILNAFDIEHIELSALLWQTGYLTFGETETLLGTTYFRLKVPNFEVQRSLNTLFYNYLTNLGAEKLRNTQIIRFILKNDFNELKKQLTALFAAIPYQNYVNNNLANYEGYYASVLYTFMASLGFSVIAEDTTNTGRIDMTLIAPQSIVIIEFKVDKSEEAALEQIKSNRYYEKYLSEGKEIYLVGIHFSSKTKNIDGFVWEKFQ